MKRFFQRFESYFGKKKFVGTELECTQELGKFLTGELNEVHTALRGYEVKFSKLKCKLLEWYVSQGF